ncbi:MAG: hypothetical protein P8166_03740 [Candidatus Thiodiazotropha sp.]|jgi:hypothetical protein
MELSKDFDQDDSLRMQADISRLLAVKKGEPDRAAAATYRRSLLEAANAMNLSIHVHPVIHDITDKPNSYPKEEFLPTDFHSAILVWQYIYPIGSFGYAAVRKSGNTPVYRLSLDEFRMEAMSARANKPGWIYGYHVSMKEYSRVPITGGKVGAMVAGEEQYKLIYRTTFWIWRV